MRERRNPDRRLHQVWIALLVVFVMVVSACSSSAEQGGQASEREYESGQALPLAKVQGEPCGDTEVCSSRPIELFGKLYFGTSQIRRARVGDVIAVAEGTGVENLQIHAIKDIEPERAFVVTGNGRFVYEQAPSFGVDGPILKATNQPGIGEQDGGGEGLQAELVVENGCVILGAESVVWDYDTTWNAERQQVIGPVGTFVNVGDIVQTGGFSFPLDWVKERSDTEALEYIERCNVTESVLLLNGPLKVLD